MRHRTGCSRDSHNKYVINFFCYRLVILAITAYESNAHSSLRPFDYNITDYVVDLPEDIREIAAKALRAEWNKAHIRRYDTGVTCTPSDANEQPCPPNKFRQLNGECNNFRHRKWGTRGSKFLRMIKPQYSDGKLQILYHFLNLHLLFMLVTYVNLTEKIENFILTSPGICGYAKLISIT